MLMVEVIYVESVALTHSSLFLLEMISFSLNYSSMPPLFYLYIIELVSLLNVLREGSMLFVIHCDDRKHVKR